MARFLVLLSSTIIGIASFSKLSEVCGGCPTYCIFGSCTITVFVSFLEIVLACAMLGLRNSYVALQIARFTFATFLVVSLFFWLFLDTKCRCFGRIELQSTTQVILNCVMLMALLLMDKTENDCYEGSVRRIFPYLLSGVVLWGACCLLYLYLSPNDANVSFRGNNVILRPKSWHGTKVSDIFSDLRIAPRTDVKGFSGDLLILRGGCEDCQSELARITRVQSSTAIASVIVLLIEPDQTMVEELSKKGFEFYELDTEFSWFVQTPLEVKISNGRVVGSL